MIPSSYCRLFQAAALAPALIFGTPQTTIAATPRATDIQLLSATSQFTIKPPKTLEHGKDIPAHCKASYQYVSDNDAKNIDLALGHIKQTLIKQKLYDQTLIEDYLGETPELSQADQALAERFMSLFRLEATYKPGTPGSRAMLQDPAKLTNIIDSFRDTVSALKEMVREDIAQNLDQTVAPMLDNIKNYTNMTVALVSANALQPCPPQKPGLW